jgi:hypothetical protein
MQTAVPPLPTKAGRDKAPSVTAWTLAGVTLALSLTSFLGAGILLLPWPAAAIILTIGIIVVKRRGKAQGISLIIAAVLIVPFSYLAQLVSLAVYGTSAMKEQEWQETQMLDNLRAIGKAKAAWIAETEARNAAPVTLADLTSYLGGKEIISVVSERYDPQPVGKNPTATLPRDKHLWDYPNNGAAYTILGLEQILLNRSRDPINITVGQMLHPSKNWLPLFWKTSPPVSPSVSRPPTSAPEE